VLVRNISGGFLVIIGLSLLALYVARRRSSLVAATHGLAWLVLGLGLLLATHHPLVTGMALLIWLVLLVSTPWVQRRDRTRPSR
jgi:hypothetical protein